MDKYIRKPEPTPPYEVEAVQFDGTMKHAEEICAWMGIDPNRMILTHEDEVRVQFYTVDRLHERSILEKAESTDWIIRDPRGIYVRHYDHYFRNLFDEAESIEDLMRRRLEMDVEYKRIRERIEELERRDQPPPKPFRRATFSR